MYLCKKTIATMTHGKRTCKILKEIRKQIAEKNDIEYVTSECHFQGECEGTCPKCEEELRYLENELQKRRQLGKVVAVAGIALGIVGTSFDCKAQQQISISAMDTIMEKPVIVTSAYARTAEGTGKIRGKVVNEYGYSLEFAVVKLIQNDTLVKRVITNLRGLFTIKSVPAGKYDILITYTDYSEMKIKDIEIKENRVIYMEKIRLKKRIIVGRPTRFLDYDNPINK